MYEYLKTLPNIIQTIDIGLCMFYFSFIYKLSLSPFVFIYVIYEFLLVFITFCRSKLLPQWLA